MASEGSPGGDWHEWVSIPTYFIYFLFPLSDWLQWWSFNLKKTQSQKQIKMIGQTNLSCMLKGHLFDNINPRLNISFFLPPAAADTNCVQFRHHFRSGPMTAKYCLTASACLDIKCWNKLLGTLQVPEHTRWWRQRWRYTRVIVWLWESNSLAKESARIIDLGNSTVWVLLDEADPEDQG